MTHQPQVRKPLDNNAFANTLRGLHPSREQLKDLEVVEKQARARTRGGVKNSVTMGYVDGQEQAPARRPA